MLDEGAAQQFVDGLGELLVVVGLQPKQQRGQRGYRGRRGQCRSGGVDHDFHGAGEILVTVAGRDGADGPAGQGFQPGAEHGHGFGHPRPLALDPVGGRVGIIRPVADADRRAGGPDRFERGRDVPGRRIVEPAQPGQARVDAGEPPVHAALPVRLGLLAPLLDLLQDGLGLGLTAGQVGLVLGQQPSATPRRRESAGQAARPPR